MKGRVALEVPSSGRCHTGRLADSFTNGETGPGKNRVRGCKERYPKVQRNPRKGKERKPTIISSRKLKINTRKQIS